MVQVKKAKEKDENSLFLENLHKYLTSATFLNTFNEQNKNCLKKEENLEFLNSQLEQFEVFGEDFEN
jgi:hypothetical protein